MKRREKEPAVQWVCSSFRRVILTVPMGALAVASVLTGQQPSKQDAPQKSGFALQQTVRRVRVDVVATDAQGHPVTGLRASDFRVAEDRKPQTIRQFEYHSDENADAVLPKRPPLPPHTFMNLPVAPEHGPLTILLYDVLNTPMLYQMDARRQMVNYLRKIPGRITIFVLGDDLRFMQGFTSDPDLIERAIGDPAIKLQEPSTSHFPDDNTKSMKAGGTNPGIDQAVAKLQALAATEANERLDRRVDMTAETLLQIARFLDGIPGRKNLIWYTGSFPIIPDSSQEYSHAYKDRIKDMVNRLNSAEVSVYSIDARGLQIPGSWADAVKLLNETSTLDEVSEQTGGRAFYNTNALEEALETSSAEGSSYYTLVYAPTNAKYDGSVRSISVHRGNEKYHLAYRRSYIAEDVASIASKQSAEEGDSGVQEKAFASAVSVTADAQFGAPTSHQLVFAAHMDAIGQSAPATTEQMAALAPYRERMAKVEHREFVPQTEPVPMQQYAGEYAVLAKQLDIPKSGNGSYHSDLSFAALAFNQDGETLWGTKTRLKDDIPALKIDKIRKDGFNTMQTFFVPVETAAIRLVVCDEHSGKIGSMEIRLPLPPDRQQAVRAQ